jgi:ATP-binding cassette subfamily C protein
MSAVQTSFLPSLLTGLRLLSRQEVKKAIWLAGAMLAGSFLEIVSLAAVLPFVNIVIQPEAVQTNKYLAWIYKWAGLSSLSQFISLVGIVVIILMVLSVLANWGILYAQNRYAASCQTRLAKDLLDRCMHAPYSWFLTRNSTLLSRLIYDDVVIWSRGLVQRLMVMVSNISVVVMALALVLTFSLGTGILVIATVAALGYAVVNLMRPLLTRLAATKRAALDEVTLSTNQALAGIKDIKLSSREMYFRDLSSAAYSTLTGSHARLNIWQETPSLIMQGLAQVTLVTLALIFWNMGLDKGQIATQLATLIIVTTKVVPTVGSLSSAVYGLFHALPHVYEIRRALDSIEAETRRASRRESVGKVVPHNWRRIGFERVGYQYPNCSDWALQDVTLSLIRGGSYGVVGPSAAGKSTFVDLLVGLLEPTAGRICVDEDALQVLEIKEWQKRIAYVPQMPFVADDSLRANVAFGVRKSEVDDKRVRDCLRLANLASLPEDLEQGLDTRLGERGLRLSGGQRQRIAIARALFNRPEILVLDEATSALDSLSEGEILAALKNLRGQVITVTIAHRLSTVASCDEIFVLEAGRLVGQGSDAELRANHELFQRMAAAGV